MAELVRAVQELEIEYNEGDTDVAYDMLCDLDTPIDGLEGLLASEPASDFDWEAFKNLAPKNPELALRRIQNSENSRNSQKFETSHQTK